MKKAIYTHFPVPVSIPVWIGKIDFSPAGVSSNFDTDLFVPIIESIEKLTRLQYDSGEKGFPFRVIADHSRPVLFLSVMEYCPAMMGGDMF